MTVLPSSARDGPADRADRRAPVLLPAPLPRLEDAAQRVLVRPDGALVHRKGSEEKLLLAAGSLQGAHVLPGGACVGGRQLPAGRGEWVLLLGGEHSLALSLPGWTPGQPSFSADPLELSGIRAVVGALGGVDPLAFDLDDIDADVLSRAPRPILIDPRPRPSRRPEHVALLALRVLIGLMMVLYTGEAIVSRIVVGDSAGLGYPSGALTVLAALLAVPLGAVVLNPLLRARGARVRRGAASTAPGRWTAAGGRPLVAVTDAGAALLIVDQDGVATAVPGPALGGVTDVFILAADGRRPTRTALVTSKGEVLFALPANWWPSDEDAVHVQALLRDAGLRLTKQRVPRAAVQPPRGRRPTSADVDEIAYVTTFFAAPLCVASIASGATAAAVLAAWTVALSVGVIGRERRRRR